MNWSGETMERVCHRPIVPRDWTRTVPEWYVAGFQTRGRSERRILRIEGKLRNNVHLRDLYFTISAQQGPAEKFDAFSDKTLPSMMR
ncbi:MAG: hypothetical protein JSU72_18610, partial [Deltaproteobacteria bacterium]